MKILKKKLERTQISKIRNEKEVTTDTTEIQRIIRDYYKQLYANKMDNLEEMDKFWEKYKLPRLSQEEIENMNISISSNEIQMVIKNLPTNKSPETESFTGESYQTLRGQLTLILLQLFKNHCRGKNTPKLRWKHQGTERLSNLLKFPQLEGGAKI